LFFFEIESLGQQHQGQRFFMSELPVLVSASPNARPHKQHLSWLSRWSLRSSIVNLFVIGCIGRKQNGSYAKIA
jgi:hypothetical protein